MWMDGNPSVPPNTYPLPPASYPLPPASYPPVLFSFLLRAIEPDRMIEAAWYKNRFMVHLGAMTF